MNLAVCLVLVGVLWPCNVQSLSLFDISRQYDGSTGVVGQCRKTCGAQKFSLWDLDGLKSTVQCFVKCVFHGLRKKAVGNGSTTSPPTSSAEKRWYSATPPSTVKPITRVDSKDDCPPNSPPGPGEIVPGHVRDVAVTFAHQINGINKRWVAEVTWSPPEGSNVTSNWRGYLPMWVPVGNLGDDSAIKVVRCQLLPKNQTKFVIDEANGWRHPFTLYLAVVALPTNEVSFAMTDFSPRVPGLGYYVTPIEVNGAHHESFSLMSTEGLAILFVGFILVAFVCLWIVKVSCLKSAKRKKTAKKMDESKEQLVV